MRTSSEFFKFFLFILDLTEDWLSSTYRCSMNLFYIEYIQEIRSKYIYETRSNLQITIVHQAQDFLDRGEFKIYCFSTMGFSTGSLRTLMGKQSWKLSLFSCGGFLDSRCRMLLLNYGSTVLHKLDHMVFSNNGEYCH